MTTGLSQQAADEFRSVRSTARMIQQSASAVEGGTPLFDDEPEMNNQDLVLLASAVRAASSNGSDRKNRNARGLHLTIDMTAVPGADTVTFTIQGKDPASGKYYTILASAAIVAVSTVVLRVYPGLAAAANSVANDVMPRTWRVIATHSAGTNFTYSIGACLIL